MKKNLRKFFKKSTKYEIFLVMLISLLVQGDSPTIKIHLENVNLVQINHIEQVE